MTEGKEPPEWPIRRDVPVSNADTARDRRLGPDDTVANEGPDARSSRTTVSTSRRNRMSPVVLAVGGLLILLFLAWLFTGNRDPSQDKLGDNANSSAKAADPEKLCASSQTYDFIKRDIFRRAAQVRGSDQAAYDKLSAYASLRMENPVLESESGDNGAANCSGRLTLDLPPNVAVAGGRRSLSADVDYTVQQAADGSGLVVLLRNADAVVTPLATLGRVAQPSQPSPSTVQLPQEQAPAPDHPQVAAPDDRSPAAPPQADQADRSPAATGSAHPSFNCANARTRGEIAVCSDNGLASLDRQMAAQFGRAMSSADPGERALLERTRNRFLAYRDHCGSDACIADSYRGRIREISDIMNGRWQPR